MNSPMHERNIAEYENTQKRKRNTDKFVIELYKNKFGRPIYKAGHVPTPIKQSARIYSFVHDLYLKDIKEDYPDVKVVEL